MFSANSTPRLLIVEDHAATREALAQLLSNHGYILSAAADAKEARRLASTTSFDVVLCDIGLPDEDGYALMEKLKGEQPKLKGIAITGLDSAEDLRRSKLAGFSAHLVKPVSFGRLKRALWRLYGGSPTR